MWYVNIYLNFCFQFVWFFFFYRGARQISFIIELPTLQLPLKYIKIFLCLRYVM